MASSAAAPLANRATRSRRVSGLVVVPLAEPLVGFDVACLNCPASVRVAGFSADKMKRMVQAWDGDHECSGKL